MMNLISMFLMMLIVVKILIFMNILISKKKKTDREKTSPFECGFDPMSTPRLPFSMQFYLISIMFLIFDVEIIIFLPMIPSFMNNKTSFWLDTPMIFILILLIGLYIEWNDGALTWLK